MATIEVDDIQVMKADAYDPLRTPYEVENLAFPQNGPHEERFTHLLRYAILAPSSHNTQPWLFRLFDNGIAVYADYTRRLPVADPSNRELLMGVGAAIMNLRIAAIHFGFDVRADYNFSGDSEMPIAFVSLSPSLQSNRDKKIEQLFPVIARRHTNRNAFLAARVPDVIMERYREAREESEASIFISTDSKRNAAVAKLVAHADRLQQADPEFRKELGEWLRPNATQKPDGMTGASFGIGDLPSTVAPWAVKTIDMGGIRAKHDERLCREAPALLVLYSEDSIPAWLGVGETLEGILLGLTRDGLQFSFFNMPIEIPEARLHLQKILGLGMLPQLLLRIGYSLDQPAPSPRRPVEDCILR
ncbi:MAG: hypothetical protein KF749_03320 [Bacteroidetes bacterium]|nr:hypothetical protein [Bacteroidota bacterium]MCW5895521.1 hypothetical protein [Bacteroidota bacterium]